jgi:hypothetical protein
MNRCLCRVAGRFCTEPSRAESVRDFALTDFRIVQSKVSKAALAVTILFPVLSQLVTWTICLPKPEYPSEVPERVSLPADSLKDI